MLEFVGLAFRRYRNRQNQSLPAAKSLQSCPTLCDPMDCSLPGFSVHGILQARTLEWVAISSSRRSSIQSAKTRQGADCGSDHELLIAKFRLKLKKVGKTTRPFSSVQFSLSVMSNSLRPHESQHTRPPCPSPSTGVHSNSHPSSQ